MTVIVAPDSVIDGGPSLFLAGGITNCPDWQSEAVELLDDLPMALLNPRRPDFDVNDPMTAAVQIGWEHASLRAADAILFWFCEETIQPITLYELGAWSMTAKPLFIGCHPRYSRMFDVKMQTALSRPEVQIHFSLPHLCESVKEWWAEEQAHRGRLIRP